VSRTAERIDDPARKKSWLRSATNAAILGWPA
jgi:hypothetical protein